METEGKLLIEIALDIFKKNHNSLAMIPGYLFLSKMSFSTGELDTSIDYLNELANLTSRHEELASLYAYILASKAEIYVLSGEYLKGKKILEQTVQLLNSESVKGGATEYLQLCYNHLGNFYFRVGLYEQAEFFYRKGITYTQKLLDEDKGEIEGELELRRYSAALHGNLAQVLVLRGNYEESLFHALIELELMQNYYPNNLAKIANDLPYLKLRQSTYLEAIKSTQALSYATMGYLYLKMNDLEKAKKYFDDALEGLDRSMYDYKRIKILLHKGHILLRENRKNEAFALFKHVEELTGLWGNKNDLPAIYMDLSDAYFLTKDYKSSKNFLRRAIKTSEEIKSHTGKIWSSIKLAQVYLRNGEEKRALNLCNRVLDMPDIHEDIHAYISVNETLGSALFLLDHIEESLTHYSIAIDTSDYQSGIVRGELSQQHITQNSIKAHDGAIRSLVHLGRFSEAFSMCEKSRNKTLHQLLMQRRILEKRLPPALANKKYEIQSKIALNNALLRSVDNSILAEKESLERENELEILKWKVVNDQINETDSAYWNLTYETPSLEEVQGHLHSEEMLLEYYLGRDNAYVFVITKDTLDVISLGQSSEISGILNQFQEEFMQNPI